MFQILKSHTSNCVINLNEFNIEKINFSFFSYLVLEHRVALIASSKLKNRLPASHPCTIALDSITRKQSIRFLHVRQLLLQIATAFVKHQITFVVLKGQPLNQLLYENRCMRHSGDIDLLVDPDHVIRAHRCLISEEFLLLPGHDPEENYSNPSFLSHYLYRDNKYQIRLELHRQITEVSTMSLYPDPTRNIQSVFISGVLLPIFDHETNFVYLCLHAAKHNWNRLQWLLDLAVYTQKIPLDWKKIQNIANRYHMTRAVLEAHVLLKDEFEIVIPAITASWLDHFCVLLRTAHAKRIWYSPLHHRKFIRSFYVCLLFPLWRQKKDYFASKFSSIQR